MQNGTVSQEQLETLLTVHYQGAADQKTLVAEGLSYIQDQLALSATPTPEPTEEPLETVEPEAIQEETEGPGAAGWIIGAAAVIALGGGGYVWYTSMARKKKEAEAAARKKAMQARQRAQSANRPANAGATSTSAAEKAGTTGATPASGASRPMEGAVNPYQRPETARQAKAAAAAGAASMQSRTGNYTSQNGRPEATGSTRDSGATQPAKPYGSTVEKPYGRYSTRNDEEEAKYTATFRPEENTTRTEGTPTRRRRSRVETNDTDSGM